MKKDDVERIKKQIVLSGRVNLASESVERVEIEEEKNIRYVYNPNPYMIYIAGFRISIRPGELLDLVQITRNPEAVYSSDEIRRAVKGGMLYGFASLDELSGKKIKPPKEKSPLDEYKEGAGIVITQEGTPVPVENIRKEGNVFAEELSKVEEEEEKMIEEVEGKRRRHRGKR